MKILDRLFRKQQADPYPAMSGSPVVRSNTPYGWRDRSAVITPERIAANRSVPVVLESLSGLSRLCFSGFDHVLKPVDASDDTQGPAIEKALAQIRLQEKRIGRIGKARNMGTIGLVRAAALDGWSFRQSVAEYATIQEANWLNFAEVQHLPAQSFSQAGSGYSGNDYLQDKILPGILYDSKRDATRFFQSGKGTMPLELDPENILYIEDVTVPDDISFLKVLQPSIEAWKEVRRYGMTAEKRIAVPNETERIDAGDLVKMLAAKIPVKMQDLIDHCDDLAENQSYANRKVALPGTRIEYPSVSMPLNPWEADKYLRDEIIAFFFKRDVLEVTAQAISATNAPSKDLLDLHIASEREIWGKPFEGLWNIWLEWNGFELVDEFAWWDWSPKDKQAEHKRNLENFRSHAMTIQTFCKLEGLPIPSDAPGPKGTPSELEDLIAQHDKIFGNKSNVLNQSNQTV